MTGCDRSDDSDDSNRHTSRIHVRAYVHIRVCNVYSRHNRYNRHVTRVIRVILGARVGSKSLICLYLRFRRVTRAFLGWGV